MAVDLKRPGREAKSTQLVNDEFLAGEPPGQATEHRLSSNFRFTGSCSEPQISYSDPPDLFRKTNFNSVFERWPTRKLSFVS